MPRNAEPGELAPVFPWKSWEAELKKSPTGALIFSREDFGEMTPRRFRELARKEFKGATASIRGEEVLVSLA